MERVRRQVHWRSDDAVACCDDERRRIDRVDAGREPVARPGGDQRPRSRHRLERGSGRVASESFVLCFGRTKVIAASGKRL